MCAISRIATFIEMFDANGVDYANERGQVSDGFRCVVACIELFAQMLTHSTSKPVNGLPRDWDVFDFML